MTNEWQWCWFALTWTPAFLPQTRGTQAVDEFLGDPGRWIELLDFCRFDQLTKILTSP
jgi:hypothetical protein